MTNETIRHKTHGGVDKVMDQAEHIRDRSMEELDRIKENAKMMKGSVDSYIKKNPEKSVLIAAGVGAVIGAIFAAAMMRRKK